MKDIVESIVHQSKRIDQLSRVENVFNINRLPPKVCEMGGIHILPGLTLRPPLGQRNRNVNTNQNIENNSNSTKGSAPGMNKGPNPGVNNGISKNPINAHIPPRGNITGGSTFSLGTSSHNNNSNNNNSSNNNNRSNNSNFNTPSKPNPNNTSASSSSSSSSSVPIQLLKYPTQTSLPRAVSRKLSDTLKVLMKKGWAKAMWRHIISLVLLDIRYFLVTYTERLELSLSGTPYGASKEEFCNWEIRV